MNRMIALAAAAMLAMSPTSVTAADFVVIRQTIDIARPLETVWNKVGDYCAIAVWAKVSCDYESGVGDVGTVRRLAGETIVEVMVARTPFSYTYLQTTGNMATTRYHGTLAAEPAGASSTRLVYTLVYDQSALSTDALRLSEHKRLEARFAGLLENMKALAGKD